MRPLLQLALIFLVVVLLVVIAIALVLAWSLGLGYLLGRFVPAFTLFEASLLVMIASILVAYIAYRLLTEIASFRGGFPPVAEMPEDWEEEEDYIPVSRFYKTKKDKTWEAWLRYEFANNIFLEFENTPRSLGLMNQQQKEELAIRLADISVGLLKNRSDRANARGIRITAAGLKQQMQRIGQKPYDQDLLQLAAEAVNEELEYEEALDVVRQKLWQAPCPLFTE